MDSHHRSRRAGRPVAALLALTLLLFVVCAEVLAEDADDPARQVHWAAGAFFGTGWYRVADGQRTLGLEIQYPLSLGLEKLDDIYDFTDFDNYSTVSFTPGVQVEIPVTEKWYLRPYANLGWGTEVKTGDSAWIYYGGLKSRYRLGGNESTWSLLNAINYAGYNPDYGKRGQYGSFMTGFEFDHPLKGVKLGDDEAWLNWHITYNYLFDKLNFHVEDDVVESVRDQWELGLALGKGNKKMKLWFLSFEHVGLSFKWSSNGTYKALSLNMSSPFTY